MTFSEIIVLCMVIGATTFALLGLLGMAIFFQTYDQQEARRRR